MKNNFFNYFKELAAKAKTTTNSEEALAIRNKLIKIGIVLLAVGGIGAFICFVSFGLIGFAAVSNFGEGFGFIFIPFFLTIPFAVVAYAGGVSLYLGLGITVAKATVNFVDTNRYCPHCGDIVKEDELYCDNCGKPLLVSKVCKNCNIENDLNSKFCKNCGNKLD